ncbi:MAG: SLBB domain-containing protein [Terriglobales bacterium]
MNRHWLYAISLGGAVGLAVALSAIAAQDASAQEAGGMRKERSGQKEAVSLSPNTMIELLRKEPGLLLEAKKALVKAASDEGRLLDAKELTDESVYELVRNDEGARELITREIEERRYVQAKPTRAELEEGLVIAAGRPASEAGAKGSGNSLAANQEDAYWESHERAFEYHPDRPAATAVAPPPQWILPPPGYTLSPSGHLGNDGSGSGDDNQTDRRRQLESAQGGQNGNPYFEGSPGNGMQSPQMDPDEVAGLVSASLADKPPDGGGKSGFYSPNAGGSPGSLGSPSDGLPSSELAGGDNRRPVSDARADNSTERLLLPSALPPSALPPDSQAGQKPRYRKNPYADVPSLYDLYQQYPANGASLSRFGEEIFRTGTGNLGELPMDLPVGPEYVLGPGDGVSIELFGGISQRLQRVVDRTGRVSLPEVGAIEVSGRSLGEVQRIVQGVLRTQFRDVQADVSLSRLRTVRVYVVGDVVRPGAYDVSSLSTPLNALYQAGGPTARGSLRILRHFRGKQLMQLTDVYDLLLHGIRSGVEGLEPGDTILVPPLGPEVTVEGMVRRPAIYELNGEKSLADILQLAGGVLRSGTLRHVEVERVEAHLSRTMLGLDLPENALPESALPENDLEKNNSARALEHFEVRDGDRIKISPILPYADKTVYLAGHVVRPGKFAYHDGMRITDIIKSYADLMPEPYETHAEIVRLNPPDFTPAVLAFNLEDALAGNNAGKNKAQDILLRPFDTIRIFGRFEFEDQPVVRVTGEVRHPGNHVTNGATRLRDAVYLAGGTTRDAELADAQIFRHRENGHLEVIGVNLTRAMEGDERDNILLEPKDQLIIHKSPARSDPAAVKVEGEVARPGKYPLGDRMTAAELVRLAGGLKRGAYTEVADLMRYQISGGTNVSGEHMPVEIARALAGEAGADVPLGDGDVLTVRQIAGWNDLGATITVKGEVAHAGAYGIREGERLSSILARAGGFRDDAYPYGAVFERAEVRELEEQNRSRLLGQLQEEGTVLKGTPSEGEDKLVKDASVLQWKTTVERLENTPPGGRLVIHISKDVQRWANTSSDIEVRAGDEIYIPKKPGVVMVDGAVFHSTAVSFKPGKNTEWYLRQAGGPSNTANRKAIFVLRADGSVAGGAGGMFTGGVEKAQLFAGDTVVVPEKAISGTTRWKSVLQVSQIAEAAAIAASVGRTF